MQGCPVETSLACWSKRKYERRISVNESRPRPPNESLSRSNAWAMLDIRSTTPKPNFELEEEWRSASDSIEDTLKPAVGELEGELAERLRVLSPPGDSKVRTDYDNSMAELRRAANEEHRQLLYREHQEMDKKGY